MKYVLLLILAAIAATPCFAQNVWVSYPVHLPDRALSLRVDSKRNVAYVSIANTNGVAVVSLDSSTVLKTLAVGQSPAGIDLSADGDTLYAALGSASLGIYDLVHDTQSEIDVKNEIGNPPDAWDVAETSPGIVFIGGGSYDAGRVARVDLATRQPAVVAGGQFIGPYVHFGKDPNGQVLYAGSSGGYYFYKLDITQPTAPIAQAARFGEASGSDVGIAANPAGDKLVLGYGIVLRAGELTRDGYVAQGVTLYSSDGSRIVSAHDSNLVVQRFDSTTLDLLDTIPTGCVLPSNFPPQAMPTAIAALPNDMGWVIVGADVACVVRSVPDQIFAGDFE